jgi:hypothetical protein
MLYEFIHSTGREIKIFFGIKPSSIIHALPLLQCPVQLSPVKTGGYPSDPGIYPMTTGIKVDLCICTIPTVGFYGKHGEVTSPPSSWNHTMIHMRPPLMTSPPPTCRCLPSPAVTRRRRCPPAVALRRKKVSITHSVGTGAGVTP